MASTEPITKGWHIFHWVALFLWCALLVVFFVEAIFVGWWYGFWVALSVWFIWDLIQDINRYRRQTLDDPQAR